VTEKRIFFLSHLTRIVRKASRSATTRSQLWHKKVVVLVFFFALSVVVAVVAADIAMIFGHF
jgi:anti-sigma-K factor RskA